MKQQLVLSLFPGIGLLDYAFKRAGFAVVRAGDWIFGDDIRNETYPAGKFDGVIGGPPCQTFSRMANMVRNNGYKPKFGNLIPEFERAVGEAAPIWFLMEQVLAAPLPRVEGYEVWSTILNNRQCYGEDGEPAEQNRDRRISFGFMGRRVPLMIETVALQSPLYTTAALSSGREVPVKQLPGGKIKRRYLQSAAVRAPGPQERQRQGVTSHESKAGFALLCAKQGLPEGFDIPAFTMREKCQAVANAVKEATESQQ